MVEVDFFLHLQDDFEGDGYGGRNEADDDRIHDLVVVREGGAVVVVRDGALDAAELLHDVGAEDGGSGPAALSVWC